MSYSADALLMRAIDEYTINEIGVPGAVLMERAALAVAEKVEEGMPVCVVYGRGNNGGDGLAAARILKLRGYRVFAVPAAGNITPENMSEEEKKQYSSAEKCGVEMKDHGSLKELLSENSTGMEKHDILENEASNHGGFTGKTDRSIIIDAVFGIGLGRAVEGEYAETVNIINKAHDNGAKVISVDIPSGISADTGAVLGTAVRADITVTFGFMKHGLLLYPGAEHAGKVYVEDAGFAVTESSFESFAGNIARVSADNEAKKERYASYFASKSEVKLPKRFAGSNKGSYGKVLIIGGNKGCAGAGYLAAHAAFMSGCGMVKVLTCTDTVALLNAKQPEAMTGVLFTDDGGYDEQVLGAGLAWADVILIGPGLGRTEASKDVLEKVLNAGKKTVVDADALNLISESLKDDPMQYKDNLKSEMCADAESVMRKGASGSEPDIRAGRIASLFRAPAILTPHIGELSRLTGLNAGHLKSHILDIASEYAGNDRLTYVCKDARTVVASKGRLHININGNSGMSTAGAGDVLAGLIAGLAAAGLEPYEAARTGVFIHAMAGDAGAKELCEDCITAGDIADRLAGCVSGLRRILNN